MQIRHLLLLTIGLFLAHSLQSQVLITEETFDEANGSTTGTMSNGESWDASVFNNCDTNPGVWGVQGGVFMCRDIEGFNCCSCGGGGGPGNCGDNQNIVSFGPIDISAYNFASILMNVVGYDAGGNSLECGSNSDDPCPPVPYETCNGGNDQVIFEYSIDGSPWVVFEYYCGDQLCFNNGTACSLAGNSLSLRIKMGTQAANEIYELSLVQVHGYNVDPVQAVANPTTVCEGESINLSEIAGFATSWNWSGPSFWTSTQQSPVIPNATTANSGTYTVEIMDSHGCINTDMVVVNVTPGPTPNVPVDPLQICYDLSTLSYTDNIAAIESQIIGANAGVTVNWYFDAAATNPINTFSSILIGSPPAVIYATLDNGSCESTTVPVNLIVEPQPDATPQTLTACDNDGNGFETFNLNNSSGAIGGGNTVNFYSDPLGTIPLANPGSYNAFAPSATVYATATSPGGCESEPVPITMNVGSGPSLQLTIPTPSACIGDNVDLSTLVTDVNGSGLPITFHSSSPAGSGNQLPSSFQTITFSTTFYALASDGVGCFDEIAIPITAAPTPTAIPQTISECEEAFGAATFNLTSLDFLISGGTGTVSYYLNSNQPYIPVGNPFMYSTPSTTVYAVVDNGTCASLPAPITLNVIPAPIANNASISACNEGGNMATFDLTSLEATVSGGFGSVSWFQGIPPAMPIAIPSAFISSSTIIYAQVDNGSCTTNAEVTLTIDPLPNVTIQLTQSILCNGDMSGALLVNSSTTPTFYDWNIDLLDGQNNPMNLGPGTYSVTITDNNMCQGSQSITINEPSALSLNCAEVNGVSMLGASDGEAQIDISGGSFPYSIEWAGPQTGTMNGLNAGSQSLTGLAAGDYSLVLTDALGCNTPCSFTISDANCNITIDWLASHNNCFGQNIGQIDITVTGANGLVSYSWNDASIGNTEDPMNLLAGTYSLTVTDADGCTQSTSIEITQPDTLFISCSQSSAPTIIGGSDGEGSVTITGSVAPYTINWSGTQSGSQTETTEGIAIIAGLAEGNYDVNITDANGCTDFCSFMINDPSCDMILDISGTAPLCDGDSNGTIELIISNASGNTTIDWDNNALDGMQSIANIGAGTYAVTVTDDLNCVKDTFITINNPTALTIDCQLISNLSSVGADDGIGAFTFSGGTPPYETTYTGPQPGMGTYNTAQSDTLRFLPIGTYHITVEDANGCTDQCSFTISDINCMMALSSTQVNLACFGDTNGSIDLTVSGSNGTLTYNWSDNSIGNIEDPADLSAGDYDVTVTDADGCMQSTAITITQPDSLILTCGEQTQVSSIGGSDGIAEINITGGSTPYIVSWSGPQAGNQIVNTEGMATINNLSNGTYSISVVDNAMCSVDCSFTITEPTCDMILDITGTDPECTGEANGTIQLSISNANGNTSIDWEVDSLDGMANVNDLLAGTYTVTVTDEVNCVKDTFITLTDPAVLSLNCDLIEGPSTIGASDASGAFSISGGTAPYSMSWAGPVPNMGNYNSPITDTLRNLSEGIYLGTLTDANGCMTECSFIVPNGPCDLSLTESHTDESCPMENNGSITLQISSSNTISDILWNDSQYDGMSTINNIGAGTYMVTVTDDNGCVESDTIDIITTNPLPNVILSNEGNICEDECYTFDLALTGTPPFIVTYSVFDGSNSNLFPITVMDADTSIELCASDFAADATFLRMTLEDVTDAYCSNPVDLIREIGVTANTSNMVSGTYCYEDSLMINGNWYHYNHPTGMEILSNAAGCDSTITVDLNFLPQADSTIHMSLCSGESITVNSEIYDENNPSGTEIATTAMGCDSMIIVNLSFEASTTVVLNGNATICQGDSTPLNIQINNNESIDIVISDNLGNTYPFSNVNNGFTTFVHPAQATTYSITQATNPNSICPPQFSGEAIVNVDIFDAEITLVSPIDCNGNETAIVEVHTNPAGNYSYDWSNNANQATLANLGAGDYEVTVSSDNGCTAIAQIQLLDPLAIDISYTTSGGNCAGENTGNITIENITGGIAPYAYQIKEISDNFNPIGGTPLSIDYVSSGTYTLMIRDAGGCVEQLTINVPAINELTVDVGLDETIKLGDQTELTGIIDFEADSIQWTPVDSLSHPNELITLANPTITTTYMLTVWDENGCVASDYLTIFVDQNIPIYIPSGFSPNDDGINDKFMIYSDNRFNIEILEFSIFDRWGDMVFYDENFLPNNPANAWDGTFQGKVMNPNVFVYYVKYRLPNGEVVTWGGDVALLR